MRVCDLEGIRTPNHQSRNLIFYPVELRGLYFYNIFLYLFKTLTNRIETYQQASLIFYPPDSYRDELRGHV